MKQINQKLWILMVMLWLSLSASAYDFEADGMAYYILSVQDLTCSVTSGDTQYSGDIIIPASVKFQNKELSVVSISKNCFKDCANLFSVDIPSSVKSIGEYCFDGCVNLKSVQLPSGITTIPKGCFRGCTTMNDVIIPISVNNIGDAAFSGSGIISIQIPEKVNILPDYCFSGCTNLKSVDIHSLVSSLGERCFANCSSLKTIQIPSSITNIPYQCFYNSGLESVEIPQSVTTIGKECFSSCDNLTYVHIPTSVTNIGTYCFEYCESLKSVTIPSSVEELKCTFYKCENLEYAATGASTISTQCFYGTNLKSLKLCKGTKVIEVAYGGANGLLYTFPSGIKRLEIEESDDEITVGYINFSEEFSINFSNYQYPQHLYKWTKEVESIHLGTTIRGAGLICPNLKELTIGSQVAELGLGYSSEDRSIANYKNLISLVSLNMNPPAIGTPTNLQYATLEVLVPDEALEIYQSDPIWGNFWNLKANSGLQTISVTPVREVTGYYDIFGRKVDESFSGIMVVCFSDGSTKKMIRK